MSGVPMSMDDNNPTQVRRSRRRSHAAARSEPAGRHSAAHACTPFRCSLPPVRLLSLSLLAAGQDNLETDSHATSQGEEELSVGWARAISLTPSYPNRVLVEPKVDFGRRSTCVVHVKHPAVSGLHCSLQHYGEGLVRLHDHSTNGTFVNSLAVGKGKSQIIHDGDEILLIRGAAEKIGYKIVLLNQRSKPMVQTEWTQPASPAFLVPPPCIAGHSPARLLAGSPAPAAERGGAEVQVWRYARKVSARSQKQRGCAHEWLASWRELLLLTLLRLLSLLLLVQRCVRDRSSLC